MYEVSSSGSSTKSSPSQVDLLVLGAGWSSTFLLPLLSSENISYAASSTTGRDGTVPFKFDPESDDIAPYERLPLAVTILITFPLKEAEQSHRLVECYNRAHNIARPNPADLNTSSTPPTSNSPQPCWIQLGSTSAFTSPTWNDTSSPVDNNNPRVAAESALLSLLPKNSCVLHLAGLYGGTRQPRNWLSRVAKSKADAKAKGALHLVHGTDVARAIIAAHRKWQAIKGRRWIINDCHVYDWWDIFWELGPVSGSQIEGVDWREAVLGFMLDDGVKALPRDTGRLGRILDGREFWRDVGIQPAVGKAWMVGEKDEAKI